MKINMNKHTIQTLESSTLESTILVALQSLWRDNIYTRENATDEIGIILKEAGISDEDDVHIHVKSLGGEDGFTVKVEIKESKDEQL